MPTALHSLDRVFADKADQMAREMIRAGGKLRMGGRIDFGEVLSECYEGLVYEAQKSKRERTVYLGGGIGIDTKGKPTYAPGRAVCCTVLTDDFFKVVWRTTKLRVMQKILEGRGFKRKMRDGKERMEPAAVTLMDDDQNDQDEP